MKAAHWAGVICAVWMCGASAASAQLGDTWEAMVRRYGEPVRDAGSRSAPLRSAEFHDGATRIDVGLWSNIVERVAFSHSAVRQDELPPWLERNSNAATWSLWKTSPADGQTSPRTTWIRSDDAAQAVFCDDTLTITSTAWAPHEAAARDQASSASTNQVQRRTAMDVVYDLAGCWRCDLGSAEILGLQYWGDPQVTVVLFTESRREQAMLECQAKAEADSDVIEVRLPAAMSGSGKILVGTFRHAPGSEALAFEPATEATTGVASSVLARLRAASLFERCTALPRWRPPPPAILPPRGMSRAGVIAAIGAPKGAARAGAREVLRYEWGCVLLTHGRVTRVWGQDVTATIN